MALRYSILPYPMGCFLSGSLPASFVPTMVMIEDRASERLLTASSVTAIELERMPIAALKAARNTFVMIPMTLVRMMTESRLTSARFDFVLFVPIILVFLSLKRYQCFT